jgi:methylsterol monooxygenase
MNIPTQQKSKARTSFSTAPLKQPAEKTVPAFEIDNFYKEALRDNATYLILSALLVVILQANVTKHYWEYLYTTQSHFVIAKAITCSMTTGIYLVLSAVFLYFDLMGESSFMWKFKTQQQKKPTIQDYIKCGKTILLNQSIVTCILFYKELKSKQIRQELPSAGEVLLHVAFSWLVREVAFYYSHRAAHHPLIYKHIHKQHHMYTAPIAFAAMYAHPIEHLVCNSLPIALGPLLIQNKIHIVTVWSWLALSYINTIFNHWYFYILI